jgi:hypothetical protein
MIPAIIAAFVYGVGCAIFGERFPFSKFNLYSHTVQRRQSAVAVFLADGEPADVWAYTDFSGLSGQAFLDADFPTGLQWISFELARWVDDHSSGSGPGPVAVSIGYRCFSVDSKGQVHEEIKILQEGRAWLKSC